MRSADHNTAEETSHKYRARLAGTLAAVGMAGLAHGGKPPVDKQGVQEINAKTIVVQRADKALRKKQLLESAATSLGEVRAAVKAIVANHEDFKKILASGLGDKLKNAEAQLAVSGNAQVMIEGEWPLIFAGDKLSSHDRLQQAHNAGGQISSENAVMVHQLAEDVRQELSSGAALAASHPLTQRIGEYFNDTTGKKSTAKLWDVTKESYENYQHAILELDSLSAEKNVNNKSNAR